VSGKAKISLLFAFVFVIVAVVLKVMTGMWLNLNSVLLALAGAAVVLAVVFDWKMYWEFLTMRTTKHGMNMGLTILVTLVFLVCVNWLANRHNKTWDVTQEKLNSLSDQTTSLLKGLPADMTVKVFYKGAAGQDERQRVKQNLLVYQEQTPRLHVEFYNSYVESELALKYLNDQPDRESAALFVFVEYHDKKVRAEPPFDESALTSAMVKATREGERKIYFVKGHGEKDLEADNDQGMREFARALEDASFKVEPLNLIEKKEIPKDAAVVAIVGPVVAYLDEEIKWLRDYVEGGGKLFIALDPGQRHNLANLTKTLGIEFQNNYVLTRQPLVGWGPAGVLGLTFDPSSEITRSFPTGASFALFPLASELKTAQGKDDKLEVKEIVKTDASTFTMNDPTKPMNAIPKTAPVTMGMTAKGPAKDGKNFEAVVFGDSDFISNRGMAIGINRDLAINSLAQLTDQADLISIRPKLPKGTMLMLTGYQRLAIVIMGLSIPLLLLISSAVIWFRRRGA
jgi:ABC-type uncharacterized transport system involved in gliding motility auxiliary subunit